MSIFDTEVTLINGEKASMEQWAGHCLLIVNTASECGYTPQLETLEELYEDYAMRGFFVIGVPCNQFGEEEPGKDAQVARRYEEKFGVRFPLLAKSDVNGPNTIELYKKLKGDGPDIEWNFEKFIVAPSGEVVGRFAPSLDPDDMKIINVLEEYLPI
ncbi:glutathione peroxidase [Corynebacterium diphtheriae]|uniref:glutathione peroxidase n=1 Tax=Corynebacterium diphtheriae TaxID=1717 RepID=UPI0009264720|nr:glutathione peroxidase [Corynebacterium diphtheriae]APM36023.1 glutathione peroxidase [Corynebacterium diphtheriae]MBG9292269.1 glutathione peroxidase [Corynebacterium diphtheriae bv. gravis]MBG9373542.1 glutathione peroxidase [Corynebacterium diphtheriae bv. gravis]OJH88186.1 glutathione peroxidase [Corynebacterium diphtheriae]OJH89532.1 glutathione peroxidase [Corynebacterium diphtheriae]